MTRRTQKKTARPPNERQSHARNRPAVEDRPDRLPVTTNKIEEEALNRGISAELAEDSSQDGRKVTEAGDLTGITGDQTTAELMREDQVLEGEEVQAVENAPDADERKVPVHHGRHTRIADYKNRNRL